MKKGEKERDGGRDTGRKGKERKSHDLQKKKTRINK